MITDKQKKLNDFIIKEAGLELNSQNHIIDQDTGLPILVKGKAVKYNNGPINRLTSNEIEFDPLNNPFLANEICNNYITKLTNEGIINPIAYGITNTEKNTEGVAVCMNSSNKIISDKYNLDSLKYIDLIAKINETDTNSKDTIKLKSYDQKPKTTRRKR